MALEMFDDPRGGPPTPPRCPHCTPQHTPEGWVHAPGCARNLPARSAREQDILTNRQKLADEAAAAAFNLDAEMPEFGPLGPNAPLDVPEVTPEADELGMGLPTANLTDGNYTGQPPASGASGLDLSHFTDRLREIRERAQREVRGPDEPPVHTGSSDPADRAEDASGSDDPYTAFLREVRQQDFSGAPQAPNAKSGSLAEARRRNSERQAQREADLEAPFGDPKGQPRVEMPAEARRVLHAMHAVHRFFSRVTPSTRTAREQEQAGMRRAYREDGAIYGETEDGMWLYHYERLIMNEMGSKVQELLEKQERYRQMNAVRDTLISDEFRQASPDDPPR